MENSESHGNLVSFENLDPTVQELIDSAFRVRENAYCPFSKFPVGSAVIWNDSDVIYPGINVENSSYGNSICAERSAICTGLSDGRRSLKAVAVVAEMTDRPNYVSPCGICRQFIFEFGDDVSIYLSKPSSIHGDVLVTSIKALLPLGFRF